MIRIQNLIDEIQVDISNTKSELKSYSTLFSNLADTEINGESLHGICFIFERIDKKFDDINEILNEIYSQ